MSIDSSTLGLMALYAQWETTKGHLNAFLSCYAMIPSNADAGIALKEYNMVKAKIEKLKREVEELL